MKMLRFAVTAAVVAAVTVSVVRISFADDGHGTSSLSKRDRLKIAAQKICPVSGKKLGSMGTPVKKKIGEEELFLCCEGCAGGEISRAHWATIHANFAKAQGKCPVMKKKLPKNPKWTIVKGQIVYICCPPCAKKIKADPKTHLSTVYNYYLASVSRNGALR